jgi:hypothetical protein
LELRHGVLLEVERQFEGIIPQDNELRHLQTQVQSSKAPSPEGNRI